MAKLTASEIKFLKDHKKEIASGDFQKLVSDFGDIKRLQVILSSIGIQAPINKVADIPVRKNNDIENDPDLFSRLKLDNLSDDMVEFLSNHKDQINNRDFINLFDAFQSSAVNSYYDIKYCDVAKILINSGVSAEYILERCGDEAFRCLFYDVPGIKEVTIPNNIKQISNGCFAQCKDLEKIYINQNVDIIGSSIVARSYSLKEIHFNDGKNCKMNKLAFTGLEPPVKLFYNGSAEEWKKLHDNVDTNDLEFVQV